MKSFLCEVLSKAFLWSILFAEVLLFVLCANFVLIAIQNFFVLGTYLIMLSLFFGAIFVSAQEIFDYLFYAPSEMD